jgi:hypothetical protein
MGLARRIISANNMRASSTAGPLPASPRPGEHSTSATRWSRRDAEPAGRSGRFGYRLHILLELKTVLGRKTATGRKTALDRLTLYQLLGYVLHDRGT